VRALLAVFTREPRARWFLLANAQSAIGTGAALVALVLIAYDRLKSPWAIALVLLADFLPVMLLGPLFGAVADRRSRRGIAITADLLRAGSFVALGLVHSFAATVVFALIAGVGTALFSPAVLAALPSLAAAERGAAVTSLYGATRDLGRTLGPLVAAAALGFISASDVMLINGATFAVSAVIIALIPFGAVPEQDDAAARPSIAREAREGLAATWRLRGVQTVLWASSAAAAFAAMANVGELLLARDLNTNASGFALLMVAVGIGVVAGSLLGSLPGGLRDMKRRYLLGILLLGVALVALAIAHSYAVAFVAFLGTGVGNGLVVVHERLIFHAAVEDRLMGRAFATLDTLVGWGFAAAFLGGGAIIAAAGTRGMFAIAGGLGIAVWVGAGLALRGVWNSARSAPAAEVAG
jgi:MFS family permease